jgi:arsenite/tail-anchored protein-transporting ATPase
MSMYFAEQSCLLVLHVTWPQDLSGGKPVRITSPMGDIPLWGMQIDPEQARQELRDVMADDGGKKLNEV